MRGVSFEEILHAELVAVKEHAHYPGQKVMLFKHRNYIWVVPFVEEADYIFLKTLYPSRKRTKEYKRGEL